jgi:uncharacterized glyoxalase superfamily protein PhnB
VVAFLRTVFDASGELVPGRPAEMRLGDSIVMVSGTEGREAFPAFLYIYVDDADRTWARAVDAGAQSLEEPIDTPYGDRRGMVRDSAGNVFQIAHRRTGGYQRVAGGNDAPGAAPRPATS